MRHLTTNYPFSAALVAGIWVLCLIPVFPETPLDGISLIDKWTHIVMYLGLCLVIWIEYLHRHRKPSWRRLLLWGAAAPVVMGGAIELVQAYCTFGYRSGEWMDWAADAVGVAAGCLIGIPLARHRARPHTDA